MKIKSEYKNENLPYEKFEKSGPEHLTDSELIGIILRTGTKEKNAVELAEEILGLSNGTRAGILGLIDISLEELLEVKGIGVVKAVKLKCIAELSKRISSATAKESLKVNSPSTIANYFMEQLRHKKTEHVILVCLDTKGAIRKELVLSIGSVNMSVVSPRELFIEAIKAEAVNIILVHNHPSGDPTPSKSDIDITKKIKEIGYLLAIPLLDHIIIGDRKYISFKEKMLL